MVIPSPLYGLSLFISSSSEERIVFCHLFLLLLYIMGRGRVNLKKIENRSTCQVTYSKRKDGILKKANELSILCDADVGVISFSPNGRLTTFASKGRVEDVFLGRADQPDELRGGPLQHEQYLLQTLTRLKHEGEMFQKKAMIKILKKELNLMEDKLHVTIEKLRLYQPELLKITSIREIEMHERFLMNELQCIRQNKKQEGPVNQITPEQANNTEEIVSHEVSDALLPGKEVMETGESSATGYGNVEELNNILTEKELVMEPGESRAAGYGNVEEPNNMLPEKEKVMETGESSAAGYDNEEQLNNSHFLGLKL